MSSELLFNIVFSVVLHDGLGMVNFAQNKTAVQSTTLFYNSFYWTADKAVDGNTNGSDPDNSRTCSATIRSTSFVNHTWEVDIGVQIIVKNVTVYGRTDTDKDQLDGVTLFLGNTSRPWIYSQEFRSDSSSDIRYIKYVFKPDNSIASFISLMRLNKILTICEVTVEGECKAGTYGSNCIETCGYCFNGNNSCSKTYGQCIGGCQYGWTGETCKSECKAGTYGFNCSETCGYCLNGINSCSKTYGQCIGGCQYGWTGETCKSECKAGTYGFNCSETCGYCLNGINSCSKTYGQCIGGCQYGWTGETCKSECKAGTYGFNCSETCGYCLNGINSCSKTYGQCIGGCQYGWSGETCKSECKAGTYGSNCSETCGYCLNGINSCSKTYGQCIGGCQYGWTGETCKSECKAGTYGSNCSETCGYCLNGNNSCSKTYGQCISGCQYGWTGETCKSECKPGTYGFNCSETCGYCFNGNNSCQKTYGQCIGGCQYGWSSETCKSECKAGTYGYNCSETCGHCLNGNNSCQKTYGQCIGGCQYGWSGETCKSECEAGTYGFKCNETCGHCLNGTDDCSKMNGHCSDGCQSGWTGETCKSDYAVNVPQAGIEISILGGSVGGAVAVVILIAVIVIIIFQQRRRQKSPPSNISRTMDDGILYENSMSVDLNYAVVSVNDVGDFTKVNDKTALPKEDKMAAKCYSENPETYYNVVRSLPRGTVSLSNLWDYVQEKCLDEKHFMEEFETLPAGPQLPTTVALRPENRKKNRYKDLYAYDINRVVLKPLGNDENDYINASFVDGYSTQRMYIASQGTTKQNLGDFWRMLWQYDVEKIVMLTGLLEGGKHKCELYWPEEEGRTSTFGSVSVTLFDTDLFADYEIRTLEMSVGNKSKRLTQFHYTAWPDKGVPRATSSVVLFWNRVNREPTEKPIVVHCSAGIGRTGTYIALDILVNQGRAEGNVNVSECVSNIRRQRVNMVQTKEQYIFLHETLIEALMLSGTATTSDKFPKVYQELLEVDSESGKRKLQLEYERLQHEDVNHETVYASISTENEGDEADSKQDKFADAKKPENKTKNRYDNILPADRHRVFLNSPVPGRNDYINAVVLPSHRRRHGFILTQMPLKGTVIDFWRMINDLEVRTIVMFNTETSKAHDIGVYWPRDDGAQYGPFSVRLAKQEAGRNYIQRTLSFSVIGVEHERFVTQFQVTNWPENVDAPESTAVFLEILDIIGSWQNEEKPVIVHCLNGAERSGLYCVISTVIERLKLEKDVAITQTIKRMRAFRHQIIPNYEQFRFCHECIIEYMKTFETYTNC